ncbi:MAG: YeeE/YedE family protein [Desulfobacterales bacterium]|nr:YeeE/YedE family protein [Desulfobacterales bacterium]
MAGLIGFFFGFVLERAGFGDAKKLTAVFYLKDFSVLKVMFTAIVVCLLGLLYFSVFGWIDLSRVYILPTYIWPQIVGGLVLGIGFVMGGYCPTTSVVATVTGKLDALIFIIGMILGSLIFAELYPILEGLYKAGNMGRLRLSDVFGINSGIVALLVCIMAVCAYWFVEKVEDKFGDRDMLPGGSRKAKMSAAAIVIVLGLVLAIINPDRIAGKRVPVQPAQTDAIETIQEQTSEAEKPSVPAFKIVDDEGC